MTQAPSNKQFEVINLFQFHIPVSANFKQVDIPVMIGGKECLPSSVKSNLEKANRLVLVASGAANYLQQDSGKSSEKQFLTGLWVVVVCKTIRMFYMYRPTQHCSGLLTVQLCQL